MMKILSQVVGSVGKSQKFFRSSVFVAAALEGSDDIMSSSRSAIFGGRGGGSSSLDFTVGIEEHNNNNY